MDIFYYMFNCWLLTGTATDMGSCLTLYALCIGMCFVILFFFSMSVYACAYVFLISSYGHTV